jgi:hypothetical protein
VEELTQTMPGPPPAAGAPPDADAGLDGVDAGAGVEEPAAGAGVEELGLEVSLESRLGLEVVVEPAAGAGVVGVAGLEAVVAGFVVGLEAAGAPYQVFTPLWPAQAPDLVAKLV